MIINDRERLPKVDKIQMHLFNKKVIFFILKV